MRYGSVCSGIEAASVAFAPLGWDPVFFAEIDPFCCALLAHRYPQVPNMGDLTQITEADVGTVDLLVAGTPCQSFSVAGKRAGLADPRGNLTLEYFALLDRLRPRWMVWENVPGLLSDDGGRTFGTCLGLLAECGYGFAYRVLDAQYFGVPQRRHRVFTVGYLGDWRPPAAVLFERHSLSGHPAPRPGTGQDVAACLTQGVDSQGKGGYAGRRREDDVNLVAFHHKASAQQRMNPSATAPTLDASKDVAICFDTTQVTSPTNRCQPHPGDPCHPLAAQAHPPAIAFTERTRAGGRNVETLTETAYALCNPGSGGRAQSRQVLAPCLTQNYGKQPDNSDTGEGPMLIQEGMMVRRLTVTECERLMGLPDGYTLIPYRGKPATDSPRYRAIGNSFAVPVVRWIGQRIQQVEEIL